jgi:hypothetical protein
MYIVESHKGGLTRKVFESKLRATFYHLEVMGLNSRIIEVEKFKGYLIEKREDKRINVYNLRGGYICRSKGIETIEQDIKDSYLDI